MANALIDENGNQSMTGLLNTNGTTITRVEADPTTHEMEVDDNTTGSDNGGNHAFFDGNQRTTMFAESSDGDGVLVSLYVNSSGQLLVDSS